MYTLRRKTCPSTPSCVPPFSPSTKKSSTPFNRAAWSTSTSTDAAVSRGHSEFQNRIVARFHDTKLTFNMFPYPVEQVAGVLDILPDHWEFHDFVGTHKGALFQAKGGYWPTAPGKPNELRVDLKGDRVLLDEELLAGVKQPSLQKAWKALSPQGRIRFEAKVTQKQREVPPEIQVLLTPLRCSIHPSIFPYDLGDLTGSLEYENNSVKLREMSGSHGSTFITLHEGVVKCTPGGGYSIDFWNLIGNPVLPAADFVQALPATLARAVKALELKDPLTLSIQQLRVDASKVNEPPDIYWDGTANLRNASIRAGVPFENVWGTVGCRGRYLRQAWRCRGKRGNQQGIAVQPAIKRPP